MLCSTCAGKQDCADYGHRWFRMSADDDRRINPELESCSRCSIIRRDDEPPAGHPESMSAELSEDDEVTLAEIERRLVDEDDDTYSDGIRQALPRLRENGGTR